MMASKRRGLLAPAMVICVAAMLTFLTGLAWAGPNPPGNNGTIKIDDTPFDDHPNNEPHVGCTFQVDFYGYDEGDLDATVTFEAHPPTTRAGDDQVLLTDTVFIGEDDNSGGGSEAGLDASETYTLDVGGEPWTVGNADGRDDMICHGRNEGQNWISLAKSNGTFAGTTRFRTSATS